MSLSRSVLGLRSSAPLRAFSSSSLVRSSPAVAPATNELDWPTFLRLRKNRRTISLFSSIPTTFAGLSIGMDRFAGAVYEPTDLILGVEPVYVMGALTIGSAALGWLAGPAIGGQIWKLLNRRTLPQFEAKEKDFFEHIKRNRADVSRQSASNPSPDYYGEKISSLRGYRQWLRDQAAFMRKAQFGEGADKVI